jgi:hypothetical protein
MMAKINMFYALDTNKPLLHETLNDEFLYTKFFCPGLVSLKPSYPQTSSIIHVDQIKKPINNSIGVVDH